MLPTALPARQLFSRLLAKG